MPRRPPQVRVEVRNGTTQQVTATSTMDDSPFSQPPAVPSHPTTRARLHPLDFTLERQTRYREAEDSRRLSSLGVSAAGGANSAPVFHTPGFDNFPASYTGPPSGTVVSAAAIPRSFGGIEPAPARESQHNQQRPLGREQLLSQHQAHESRGISPRTASGTNPALPPLDRFGILPPSPAGNRVVDEALRTGSVDLARTSSADGSATLGSARSGQSPVNIVENPPDLDIMRQRLFDLEEAVILTKEEYDMYFPWVDNVYSHRSSQKYKRKTLVTRYFDCRMKGRPSGTAKSNDPNIKKRKRGARQLNLCDVKIKITEYPAGSAAELRQTGDSIGLRRSALEEALARGQDGPYRVIQRINGSGGSGTNVGSDGRPATHKHDLRESDAIKKSTALRHLAEREKEAKRNQKPSPWNPRGEAATTAKNHAKDAGIKFYSACFCPFSQRVWIALETKGLEYQYCETYPLRKPKPTPLLEANPRGLVPAIWQDEWACAESSVILEYLEDFNGTVPLYPTVPKLKANCRLWIDFINTRIVPSFYSVLAATEEARKGGLDNLQRHISELVQAADEKGPYFLGDHMCLVDVHLAPFALRLSRLTPFWGLVLPTPESRWSQWLDALEQNPHVRGTTSPEALYKQSVDDLVKGFQGMSEQL